MSYEWETIYNKVRSRQESNTMLLEKMIEVRRRYNAEWVLPWSTDMDGPDMPPMTPLLIGDMIDFNAQQAASTRPYFNSPTLDPSKDKGRRSREYASIRRKTLAATYHDSKMPLLARRGFRHLTGYATAAIVVVPDFDKKMPVIELRDPLSTYPEPAANEDLSPPRDCAFVTAKSAEWVRRTYPEAREENGGPVPINPKYGMEGLWDLVEWVDEDETVIGILGITEWRSTYSTGRDMTGPALSMELRRWKNRAGMCTVITPQRVTLDKIGATVANLTGMVDYMAHLQSLQLVATERAIFPDMYIIGTPQGSPKILGGHWKDGRTGEVNILQDAHSVGELRSTPDPTNTQQIDRIERNVRISGGLPPQAGGESYGALRTGRGMDSLMSAAVDPRIQEMHEIWSSGLEELNTVIFETYKGYWNKKKFTMFTGWGGDVSQFDMIPSEHIETTKTVVAYAIPGADAQGTTIMLGQLNGMKAIPLSEVRAKHPFIDDPDEMGRRVEIEALEQAMLEGVAQHAAQGQIAPAQIAAIIQARKKSGDLTEAVMKADEEMKKQQAQAAPPPGEGEHAPPEQMPGVGPPGAGMVPPQMPPGAGGPGGGPMPGEIGPNDNQRGLRRLMESLNSSPPVNPNPPVPA